MNNYRWLRFDLNLCTVTVEVKVETDKIVNCPAVNRIKQIVHSYYKMSLVLSISCR